MFPNNDPRNIPKRDRLPRSRTAESAKPAAGKIGEAFVPGMASISPDFERRKYTRPVNRIAAENLVFR